MSNTILVTGGAGYIGGVCSAVLLKKGINVIVFDNLSTGSIETVNTLKKYSGAAFIKGSLLNINEIKNVFADSKIDAVMHFAAFSQVGESIKNPMKYYKNNIESALNLFEAMINFDVKKLVFSSTASVYGEPLYTPVDEKHPLNPVNPYGQTKLMIEKILDDYNDAYGLKSVRLRYFNAAGALIDEKIGERHEPETHLVPNILKSAFTGGKTFELYGNSYNTKDGTCIRDYIDIEDLASAHIKALEYLNNGGITDSFNLGTNQGSTVKEVFEACREITGKEIPVKICPERKGDPAVLIADNTKACRVLGWKPLKTLKDSIKSAYEWEKIIRE